MRGSLDDVRFESRPNDLAFRRGERFTTFAFLLLSQEPMLLKFLLLLKEVLFRLLRILKIVLVMGGLGGPRRSELLLSRVVRIRLTQDRRLGRLLGILIRLVRPGGCCLICLPLARLVGVIQTCAGCGRGGRVMLVAVTRSLEEKGGSSRIARGLEQIEFCGILNGEE